MGGLDSQVVDDGDPHVRVGLQAEGQECSLYEKNLSYLAEQSCQSEGTMHVCMGHVCNETGVTRCNWRFTNNN